MIFLYDKFDKYTETLDLPVNTAKSMWSCQDFEYV